MTAQRADPHRWVPVAPTWLGHRPEPLIHERTWSCPLMLDDNAAATRRAGVDADGRFVAMRDHDHVETVAFEPGAVVVSAGGAPIVRTELDAAGRPLRSLYPRDEEERYAYDGDGRLVEIAESSALGNEGARLDAGGALTVEHDDRGPKAIVHEEYGTVWERLDERWTDVLARGAGEVADGLIEAVAACDPRGVEVFALSLTYVDQGSLHPILSLGLERDRRQWLADELDGEELAENLWYLIKEGGGLEEIETDLPAELDGLLLREAALNQPGDPYRAVLHEVASRLARHDWQGVIAPTDDFVVFIAEHDEGFGPKHESVRIANPPERVAAWDARWPAGAPRDDDEWG